MAISEARRTEIDAFIKSFKGTRDELNRALKAGFNVQLTNPGKYSKHTGLKQRLRNLKKQGLSHEEALDRLTELEEANG